MCYSAFRVYLPSLLSRHFGVRSLLGSKSITSLIKNAQRSYLKSCRLQSGVAFSGRNLCKFSQSRTCFVCSSVCLLVTYVRCAVVRVNGDACSVHSNFTIDRAHVSILLHTWVTVLSTFCNLKKTIKSQLNTNLPLTFRKQYEHLK